MSKDAGLMNDHNQPPVRERGAGFYVRAGWLLTLLGAGMIVLCGVLVLSAGRPTRPDA